MGAHSCFTVEKDGNIWLSSIAWSPNGENIAVASIEGGVQAWRVDGSSIGSVFAYSGGKHKGLVDLITWSPDGKYIAYGMPLQHSYVIQVFEAIRAWPLTVISAFVTNRQDVDTNKPLTWTSDGRYIAFGYLDGTIQMFEAFSGRTVSSAGNIQSILFSPDRKYVISQKDRNQVLEASSQNVISVFNGHQGRVMKSVWAPNGQYIASSGLDDYTIKIWNAFSGKELYSRSFSYPHNHNHYLVEGIAWSPNERYIAFGSDKEVYVIEMKSETSFVY
jgi:WD40 repeat protein